MTRAIPAPGWPVVPACYGWLSLDRRGRWRLQREPVTHRGLIDFLNQRYGADEHGNWLVGNGPQRVYVSLDYTPWVLRLSMDGSLLTHTGASAGAPDGVYIDEDGSVLVHAACGIGLVDDRDLPRFIDGCRRRDGAAADDDALLQAMAGEAEVRWRDLPLEAIRRAEVPARFGFEPAPAPTT